MGGLAALGLALALREERIVDKCREKTGAARVGTSLRERTDPAA